MAVTLVNPYCSLAQLKRELKIKDADTSADDNLCDSINQASRWLDRYTGRRFYFVDTLLAPLTLDEFNAVYDELVIIPHKPIRSIAEVSLGGAVLVENVDYRVMSSMPWPAPRGLDGLWWLGGGKWNLNRASGRTLVVKGQFGYLQPSVWTVAVAGDAGSQTSAWSLTGLNRLTAYWKLQFLTPNYIVTVAADAAFATVLASGSITAATGAVTLAAFAGSGVSGTVTINYTGDDTDAANVLTATGVTITTSAVPSDLPQEIVKAAVLVSAAFSGQNRKEVAGLDGQPTVLLDNAIPKTVFDMLGKRSPVLV